MSANHMNRVTLIGRLGNDPESKTFNNGGKVVNFRLATSERWKDKSSGEMKERTEWHSVAIYNPHLCGIVLQYAVKGSLILVEGSLRTRKWQDSNGNDRYTTEVVLANFDGTVKLFDGKSSGQQSGGGSSDNGDSDGGASIDDDEIPF